MRLAVAGDHSALAHKAAVVAHLRAQGHSVDDLGPHDAASCDYPDYGLPAARGVAAGRYDRAVLICGTGIGMSIAANKVRGVRCGLAHSVATARLAAGHNRAQVLALGARIVDAPTAVAMVEAWLTEPFEERHQRRLDKIAAAESEGPAC